MPDESAVSKSEQSWPSGTIFTVGHSTLPIEKFIALLKTYDIEQLADIRTLPRSRYNPQFNDTSLEKSLPAAAIAYVPMKELGGMRKPRKDTPNSGWRHEGFQGYADYMETQEFQAALVRLIMLGKMRRTAIMCAEGVPWRCHRSLVADALAVRDVPVAEILSEKECRAHQLTSFARVNGTHITYPPEQASLF